MATTVDAYPLTPDDLLIDDIDESLAYQQITAVVARASLIAPCVLREDLPDSFTAARAVLVDVVVRRYWARKRGLIAGVSTTREMGGRHRSDDARTMSVSFTPQEIAELQEICRSAAAPAGATAPTFSFPDARPWPDGACG